MGLAEELDQLMQHNDPSGMQKMSRSGLTLAKVTNINDEKKLNRIKCLPIGAADDEETDWCYMMTPMAGPERGLFLFPQVGDLVVLAYLDGDPHRPFVLGCFWNSVNKPPVQVKDGKVCDYLLKTPNQISINIHDEEKKQTVTLTMPSGTKLQIDDEKSAVSVKDKNGDNAINMDLKGGNISVKAKTKIELSAGKTTLTLEQSGNISAKGNGTISLEGTNVTAKAKSKAGVEGATCDVKATGILTLKGSMTKIN